MAINTYGQWYPDVKPPNWTLRYYNWFRNQESEQAECPLLENEKFLPEEERQQENGTSDLIGE
jgi:hypothetical protein